MGEYTEMILSGSMCQTCGVFFDSEPGFPRYCKECAKELKVKSEAIIALDEI